LKLAHETAGNTLELIGIGNDFLNRFRIAQQLREWIDKWNYIKLQSFCTTKEMGHQIEEVAQRKGEKSSPAIQLTRV
jgi:hypothetical protein